MSKLVDIKDLKLRARIYDLVKQKHNNRNLASIIAENIHNSGLSLVTSNDKLEVMVNYSANGSFGCINLGSNNGRIYGVISSENGSRIEASRLDGCIVRIQNPKNSFYLRIFYDNI